MGATINDEMTASILKDGVILNFRDIFSSASTGMSGSAIALAIVLPLLSLIILGIAAVLVYRRWKKRKERMNATDDRLPMNPITPGNVSQLIDLSAYHLS